jgi:DNA-binding transcriptional ArsR family regulator
MRGFLTMSNLYAPNDDQLLTFFKAMADANRLKIVGLLAQQPYSVEQLAAMLDLKPSTVSHHLKLLSEAGLVSARAQSYTARSNPEPSSRLPGSFLSRIGFPRWRLRLTWKLMIAKSCMM